MSVYQEAILPCPHSVIKLNCCRFLIIGILLGMSAHGQSPDELGRAVVYLEMERPAWEDVGTNHLEVWYHLPGATSFLRKTTRAFGTGFFLVHHARSYIVTAAHVVGGPTDPGTVVLIQTNGLRKSLDLNEVRVRLPGARWFSHPKADVAVHPYCRPDNTVVGNADLQESMISTNELELLSPVCALGFPVNLGTVGEKLSPIATECQTSSRLTIVPDENPQLNFILLDKALAQGYSGAPIFTLEQPFKGSVIRIGGTFHPSVIGIYKAQRGDIAGGKHSIIVPASYLMEIFQQPEFLDYEKQSSVPAK